jgi:hypothetical protein
LPISRRTVDAAVVPGRALLGLLPSSVRRTSKAGTGRAEYIEQREGIYRLSRRSGFQIHLFSSHPVRLVGSGDCRSWSLV